MVRRVEIGQAGTSTQRLITNASSIAFDVLFGTIAVGSHVDRFSVARELGRREGFHQWQVSQLSQELDHDSVVVPGRVTCDCGPSITCRCIERGVCEPDFNLAYGGHALDRALNSSSIGIPRNGFRNSTAEFELKCPIVRRAIEALNFIHAVGENVVSFRAFQTCTIVADPIVVGVRVTMAGMFVIKICDGQDEEH